ncbi:MAG: YbhB/YbcL family Raf kinase inhibitor-like protein [Candidatus Paceibacteria bacterium]
MKTILFIIVVIIIAGSFVIALNNSGEVADVASPRLVGLGPKEIINNEEQLMDTLKLTSKSFENNGNIPSRHTCDGEGISPELSIEGIDENAKSLVLIMDDPDAPSGTWDHWVKFNISTSTTQIKEGGEPDGASGVGTSGNREYFGPCPPDREHRYFFKLFSLDTELELEEGATKREVEKTMEGHILQQTELVGLYERNQ